MDTTQGNGKKLTPLSEQQLEVASFIEQCYYTHGNLPTNEVIEERLGVKRATVARYWNDSKFREALLRRGVDLRPQASKDILAPKQLLLANMLLNLHDKRSTREKLEACEVTSQQYNAWLRQASFSSYLKMRAEQLFSASDHVAYTSLINSVDAGDINATKLFFEMRGIYTPKAQLDVDVGSVLVRVVEIVAKHVKDPEVIALIADEIDSLTGAKPVAIKALTTSSGPGAGPDISF